MPSRLSEFSKSMFSNSRDSFNLKAGSKWSLLLGNAFEHYDMALFNLLTPFFASLFFPDHDPLISLLMAYLIIPFGMIARPFGALFFGYIGDTRGRKEAIMLSLTGMAFVTACMALLPTYDQIGFFAPLLLSLCRILQNFFISGETVGGAILLMENTPESSHDLSSSLYNASTIAGILLASIGTSIIYFVHFSPNAWRLLYLLGFSTALFALALRKHMIIPNKLIKKADSPIKSTLKICWEARQEVLTIGVAAGFSYSCFTMALLLVNGFIPLISTFTKLEMLHLNTLLLVLDFLLLPIFGLLANHFSRERMMICAGIVAAITGVPLFLALQGASFLTIVFIRISLVIIGVWFSAPFYAWSQKLVPEANRFTIVSFAYAIGSQAFGGATAAISLWLFQTTGTISSVAWYWMFLGLLSSLLIAHRLKKMNRIAYS